MKFIADFHIHSHYSIATSKELVPEYVDYWARLKGIKVVGTGDFTHPGWLEELELKLEPAEPGLYRLKEEYILQQAKNFSSEGVRFVLTAEISNIYKKYEKVRKVHNVIFAPDFATVQKIQRKLEKLGNIRSDGRPILGLDSRDLLEVVLDCSERAVLVPAHIWTPWFSALGAKSGFDSIEECYSDLSDHIFALETGLSSDPPMNWMCSFLDRFTLISNSDAHSPDKLGREANLFNTELSYDGIFEVIKTGDEERFLGTIEFFPQEGKYHYDGHRKCGVCWNPLQTIKNDELCPVCGKKVTVGVMNRVVQLADRDNINGRNRRTPFYSLVPLKEILSEILGCAPGTKKVSLAYYSLVKKAESEFKLFLDMSIDDVRTVGDDVLAEAIRRMRNREIYIKEGFDGQYGEVRVFPEDDGKLSYLQDSLLIETKGISAPIRRRPLINFDLREYRWVKALNTSKKHPEDKTERGSSSIGIDPALGLNEEQRKAVMHFHGPALVLAGPGTGKTHTLTARIAYLILNRSVPPEHILAFAFTNKAVGEMRERLQRLLGVGAETTPPKVSTFHSFGLWVLKQYCEKFGREKDFSIIHEEEKREILRTYISIQKERVEIISDTITRLKQALKQEGDFEDTELSTVFSQYQRILKEQNVFDLDDLLYFPVKAFISYPEILNLFREQFRWICIDEYQDLNYAQYHMIRQLMPGSNADLFVIGDPNQAIYGFRGADVRFIRSFLKDYPDATVYRLNRSYRCSDTILRASSQVIENMDDRSLLEGCMKGVAINISQHPTERSEAEFVARSIERMMGGVRFFSIDSQITEGEGEIEINSLSEFAVLCRINPQLKLLEKAFDDHGIPFQTVGNNPFFNRVPIKPVLDLLKISKNPKNIFLIDKYITKGVIHREDIGFLASLMIQKRSVKETVVRIVDKFFHKVRSEQEALFQQLLHIVEDFGDSLEQFFDFVATGTGADTYRGDIEKVTLMTLHAAKGLEFPCVFIVGCEDGLLPYSLFKHQIADFDEERRLFYVGMTRAKHFLFLSHAKKHFLFGREYHLQRTPFLDSIEEELVQRSEREYSRAVKRKDNQLELF